MIGPWKKKWSRENDNQCLIFTNGSTLSGMQSLMHFAGKSLAQNIIDYPEEKETIKKLVEDAAPADPTLFEKQVFTHVGLYHLFAQFTTDIDLYQAMLEVCAPHTTCVVY